MKKSVAQQVDVPGGQVTWYFLRFFVNISVFFLTVDMHIFVIGGQGNNKNKPANKRNAFTSTQLTWLLHTLAIQ